jgi:hypothetical protein
MKKSLLFLFTILTIGLADAQIVGIVGPAADGWPDSNNQTDIMLTNNGDGTHTISGLTLTTGPAKFRENQVWDVSYGGLTFPTGSLTDNNIPVEAGVYDIEVNLNDDTYTFTDVSTFTEIELIGSSVIGSELQLSTIDGINYELSVTEFQNGDLVFQEVGTSNTFGAASFPSGVANSGGVNIPVSGGFYEVSFNFDTGDYNFNIPNVGLVGPGISEWPSPNNPPPDVFMESNDGNIYTLNFQIIEDGEVKFRQNQNWNTNWGSSDFPSGTLEVDGPNNIPAIGGIYDITFVRSALTFDFQERASARAQIIHNSSDPSAEVVDVYLNGDLLLDDFAFRTATPFIDAPANTPITIDIAPGTSADVSESLFTVSPTLAADETYIVVASGVLDPTLFDDSVNAIAFSLEVFEGAREAAAGNTDLLVYHGSPDAPAVDVVNQDGGGILVDDISYPQFQGYLELATLDYLLDVELADNSSVVASYLAPLQTLGLSDLAITVLASGFLNPTNNQNGAEFGLWVALPSGGDLVELPLQTLSNESFNSFDFTYYPNPVNDILSISTASTVDNIKVYNMLGQMVVETAPKVSNPQVDMNELQSGVYLVTLEVEGSLQTFRVIKQ